MLMDEGLSPRAMAARQGVSYSTIRYWMRVHQLETPRARRLADTSAARAVGASEASGTCSVHGEVALVRRASDGFRCPRCRQEAVAKQRRRIKQILVAEAGGACQRCGYDRYVGALHFHHLDPAKKSFALGLQGVTRSLARCRAEASKCVLLCANCHAEVEAGGFPSDKPYYAGPAVRAALDGPG